MDLLNALGSWYLLGIALLQLLLHFSALRDLEGTLALLRSLASSVADVRVLLKHIYRTALLLERGWGVVSIVFN